jgi:hypothetical protein
MRLISTTSSPKWKITGLFLLRLVVFCLLALAVPSVRADLSPKQARKLITRMPGFELTSGSVRIKSIAATSTAAAEVAAEIRTVFKFQKDHEGSWRVGEIRTRPNQWEDVALLAKAFGTGIPTGGCNAPDPPFKGTLAVDPSVKRARCLLGALLGVEIPSDAVRIQEIAPLPIPLAPQPSATVVAWIRVDARVSIGHKGWEVAELRTGNRDWVKLAPLVASLDDEKKQRARAELESIARALELFRAARGYYVVSDKQSVVIDYLTPRYLADVIRVDPWHQPYKYDGQRDHFTLRSSGPDGKDNTQDDVVLSK